MKDNLFIVCFILLFLGACGSQAPEMVIPIGSKEIVPPSDLEIDRCKYKISADLREKLESDECLTIDSGDGGFNIAVQLNDDSEIEGDIRYRASKLINAVFLNLDKESIYELAKKDSVLRIEENYRVRVNLFYSTRQIGARNVWGSYKGATFGGTVANIRLAVVDTGVDENHDDFNTRVVKTANCYNVESCGDSQDDDHGHGTHVAGVMLGGGDSCDEVGDVAYFEFTGTFSELNQGVANFFPLQFINDSTSGTLEVSMTWDGAAGTSAGVAFSTKSAVENGENPFYQKPGSIASSGPGVTAAKSFTPVNPTDPISATSSTELLVPYAFAGYTSDSSLVGKSYWARVKTIVQGWVGDVEPRMAGVAPESQLVAIKALGSDGSANVDDIIRSLEYLTSIAQSDNIIAVNLSFSIGSGITSEILNTAVRSLVDSGVAVVVSAGNEQGSYNISSPGNEASVITVGAVNHKDEVTAYTCLGALYQSVTKPDVLAPGGSYVTRNYIAAPRSTYLGGNFSIWNDQSDPALEDPYALKIGTSQSAPFVTGLMGLMANKRNGSWAYGSATLPNLFKMIICMTAFEVGAAETGAASPGIPERAGGLKDRVEGYGRICAQGALSAFDSWDVSSSTNSTQFTFGDEGHEQKSFVRKLSLDLTKEYNFSMDVPASSDFDLYLFRGTPDENGEPVLLASSTFAGSGTERIVDFIPTETGIYYIVSKWISGSDSSLFTLDSLQDKPATPMEISNFRIDRNMRDKNILAYWKTNLPAISTLQYGTTGGMGEEESNTTYKTEHEFTIDIEYDNYYYIRGVSNSQGSTDLEISTATTSVRRVSTYKELEDNIVIGDLPMIEGVGGCGVIESDKTNFNNLNLAVIMLPFFMLLVFRWGIWYSKVCQDRVLIQGCR